MNKFQWAMAYIRTVVFGDPIKNARAELAAAVKAFARRDAEVNYELSMAKFFRDQAASIDPNQLWWEFAHAKQCERDHLDNLEIETFRADASLARQEQALQRFQALTEAVSSDGLVTTPLEPGTPEWAAHFRQAQDVAEAAQWPGLTAFGAQMSLDDSIALLQGRAAALQAEAAKSLTEAGGTVPEMADVPRRRESTCTCTKALDPGQLEHSSYCPMRPFERDH